SQTTSSACGADPTHRTTGERRCLQSGNLWTVQSLSRQPPTRASRSGSGTRRLRVRDLDRGSDAHGRPASTRDAYGRRSRSVGGGGHANGGPIPSLVVDDLTGITLLALLIGRHD